MQDILSAQQLAEMLVDVIKPNEAIATLTNGSFGIATDGELGYRPTHLQHVSKRYDQASDVADQANELLFPDRPKETSYWIVLRSMRTRKK